MSLSAIITFAYPQQNEKLDVIAPCQDVETVRDPIGNAKVIL
jgi:hypothetical protein